MPNHPIRQDASYLVTGGLGALGLATARWLADQNAGGVVLLSRRPPNGETLRVIEDFQRAGTMIHVVAGDVANFKSLASALASLPRELPPIVGVLHAAGVLRDALINQMSLEDFEYPFGAKTLGTWNLHRLAEQLGWELDFMILFSSVSAVLGTGGQANYGAANAYLDAFARYRSGLGKPTIAINWGAFDGDGMAQHLADTMRSQGVELLPTRKSLALMGEIIRPEVRSQLRELTVFRADWNRFGGLLNSMMSGDLKYTLIEQLVDQSLLQGKGDPSSEHFVAELRSLSPDDQRDRLRIFFASQMADIMGTESEDIDVDAPLTALGMDSLMAIELGNKMKTSLQIDLPMSIYLEGPSVSSLANYVCGVLSPRDDN